MSNRRIYIVFIFVSIILSTLFTACKKINEGDIVGRWKYINMYNMSSPIEEVWEFTSAKNLYITQADKSTPNVINKKYMGRYSVIWKGSNTVVKITDLPLTYLNLSWTIKNMNEDILVLFSNVDRNYMLREFTKIK
jgi:hypothetical protein